VSVKIPVDREKIADFCRRWKIAELSFFGSVLQDNFRHDSDVDILVTFAPDAGWSLFDHVAMEEELAVILGRKVDLVSRRAVERSSNWIRCKAILETAEPYYVTKRYDTARHVEGRSIRDRIQRRYRQNCFPR